MTQKRKQPEEEEKEVKSKEVKEKMKKRESKNHIKGQGTLLQMKGIKGMIDVLLDREKKHRKAKRLQQSDQV